MHHTRTPGPGGEPLTRLLRHLLVGLLALITIAGATSAAAADDGQGAGPAASAAPAAEARVGAGESRAALDYWTPERMRGARPAQPGLSGRPATAATPPDRGRPESVPPVARSADAVDAAPAAGGATGQRSGPAATAAPSTTAAAAATEGYWPYSSTANPARQVGRLFFVTWNPATGTWRNSWCSGSVVNSENKSVVWTAGHCVFETYSNSWNRNYVFCPGYNNGACPLGRWTPYSQSTTTQWQNARCDARGYCTQQEFQYDFGALKMNALNGYRIVGWVGGHGIQFNGALQQTQYLFGYPGNKSNGQYLYYCHGQNSYNAYYNLQVTCTAGGGASGGPWLTQINASWLGNVRSVNSHGGSTWMGGPYQGNVAANLFAAVRY